MKAASKTETKPLIWFVLGSSLERIAVYTASRYVKKNKNFRKDVKEDVEFSVVLPEGIMIGKDFTVKVGMPLVLTVCIQ